MPGTERQVLLRRDRLDRRADRRQRSPRGKIEVAVHLVSRDKAGKVLVDQEGRHAYDFRGDLVQRMTIEE